MNKLNLLQIYDLYRYTSLYLKKSPTGICSAGLFAIFALTFIVSKDMYFIKTLYREILAFLVGMICNTIIAWITNLKLSMMIEIIIPFTCLMVVMVWFRLNHEALKRKHIRLESVTLLLFEKLEGQMTENERLQFLMNLRPEEAKDIFNNKLNSEKFLKQVKDDNLRRGSYL